VAQVPTSNAPGLHDATEIKEQLQQQNPYSAVTIVSKLQPYDPVEVEQHQPQP
jgi:hypothetical protein